jgi:hypothetical protein
MSDNSVVRIDVLCGCGWGILGCAENDLPYECPNCGYIFAPAEDDSEECNYDYDPYQNEYATIDDSSEDEEED